VLINTGTYIAPELQKCHEEKLIHLLQKEKLIGQSKHEKCIVKERKSNNKAPSIEGIYSTIIGACKPEITMA
jgi:hypothetical protein